MAGLTQYEKQRIKEITTALDRQRERLEDVSHYESVFFIRIIERLIGQSVDRRAAERKQVEPHEWRARRDGGRLCLRADCPHHNQVNRR